MRWNIQLFKCDRCCVCVGVGNLNMLFSPSTLQSTTGCSFWVKIRRCWVGLQLDLSILYFIPNCYSRATKLAVRLSRSDMIFTDACTTREGYWCLICSLWAPSFISVRMLTLCSLNLVIVSTVCTNALGMSVGTERCTCQGGSLS